MLLLYALFGLLAGGFLNLCADYLPRREPLGRPRCPYCQQPRPAWDWLAVVGYLLGRRHCLKCGAPFPLRVPVVEVVTMLTFAYLWQRYTPSPALGFLTLYTCVFILVAIIDLEHRLVLNVVMLPAILLALVGGVYCTGLGLKATVYGGALAFVVFYLIALAYPGGMGAGDVTLATFVGLVTGFPYVILALLITILAGGVTALGLVIARLKGRKSHIPYGPFLVIGGLATLFWAGEIIGWYFSLY